MHHVVGAQARIAVCCSALQSVTVRHSQGTHHVIGTGAHLTCVRELQCVLQCVAVCYTMLQCAAVLQTNTTKARTML